jgi:hypothetical protein
MRRRLPSCAVAVLSLALLAACGSTSSNGVASKSPTEIFAAAKGAAGEAKSVHLVGQFSTNHTPVALNLTLAAGQGAQGEITQHGDSFQIVALDGEVYIYGSRAFYEHFGGHAAAQLFQGKWLKAPAHGGEFASLSSLTDMRALLGTLLRSEGELNLAGTTKVEGQRVVGVTDAAHSGTLYVATTGKPYPVAVVQSGGYGKLVFNEWDAPVTIHAPANPIDIEALERM